MHSCIECLSVVGFLCVCVFGFVCVYVFAICNHSSLIRCMSSEFLWQTFLDGSTEQQPLHSPTPTPAVFGFFVTPGIPKRVGLCRNTTLAVVFLVCAVSRRSHMGQVIYPSKNTLKGEGVMKYTVYNGKNCTHNYNGWSRPFFRLHVVVMLLSAYHAYEQRRPIFYRVCGLRLSLIHI